MPLGRFGVRNEYGLGSKELYKDGVELEDPKVVLDGVVVAGLVGLLRQLGDLSQFASEVFHGLQEEVASTSSRSRKLVTRIQHVEASLPSLEKAILSQTSHMHFAYAPGYKWHPRVKNAKNHFISNDLPHFIMDSYEECHEPPRLQLLDRFDISGPGSCLKRYTDPTFSNKEKSQRGRKTRKLKRRRSSQGSEQLPNSVTKMTNNEISSQTSREVSSLSQTDSTFESTFGLDLGNPSDALNSKEGHGISKNMDFFSSMDGNTVETSEKNHLNDQKVIQASEFMDLNYEIDDNTQLAPVGVESFSQADNLSENGSISKAYIDQEYTDTKESPDVNNSQGGYLSELASSPESNTELKCTETVIDTKVVDSYELNYLHRQEEVKPVNVRSSIEEEEVLSEHESSSESNASENHPTKNFDLHEHDSVEENSSEGEYDLNEHNLVIPRFSEGENSPELIANSDIGSGPLNSELSVGDIQYMLESIEDHVFSPPLANLSIADKAPGSISDDNVGSGQSDCAKLEARVIREENDTFEDTFTESENNLNVIEWHHEEDTGSDTDDFVDALNTIDSDSESDFETDMKTTVVESSSSTSIHNPDENVLPHFSQEHSMENISTFICKLFENENASTEPMADKFSHSEDEVCDVSEKPSSFLSLVPLGYIENKQSSQQSEVTHIQEQFMKSASSFPDETQGKPVNSVDAFKMIDSDSESDFETDMKQLVESSSTSIHNSGENASTDPVGGKINNSEMEVECHSGDYNLEDGVCGGPEKPISPISQSCPPFLENDHPSQQPEVATEQEHDFQPHFSQEHSMQNASTFICKSSENASTDPMADTISDAVDGYCDGSEKHISMFSQSLEEYLENDQSSQNPEVATEKEKDVFPHFSQEHSMDNISTFECKSPENASTNPMADKTSHPELEHECHCRLFNSEDEVCDGSEKHTSPHSLNPVADKISHLEMEHKCLSRLYNPEDEVCEGSEKPTSPHSLVRLECLENKQSSQQSEVTPVQEQDVPQPFSQEESSESPSSFPDESLRFSQEKSKSPENASTDPVADKISHSADKVCDGSEKPSSPLSLVHLECFENANLECLENKQSSQQSEETQIQEQDVPQCFSQENPMESASSFPDETQGKPVKSFGSTSSNPYALWTNGSLLGLQPSKPTVSSTSNSVNSVSCGNGINDHGDNLGSGSQYLDGDERNIDNDQITPGLGNGHVTSLESVVQGGTDLKNVCSEVVYTNLNDKLESEMNSPPPSPPLEHMKISFQPIMGFETCSKLKLKYPVGIDHHEFSVKTFPSFLLVPESTTLHHETDSDNDTFCGSYPCMSDESVSYCSDSDSEQWEARDISDFAFYDGLRRISSTETSSSYSHQEGSEQGNIHFYSRSLNTADLMSGPISQLPTFDPQILESIFSRVFEDDPDKLQSTIRESDTTAILQKVNAIRQVVGTDSEDDSWSNT